MSVLTNAGLGEKAREKLLDEGFAIQVMDDASLLNPPTAYVEADIVVIDRSLLGLSSLKAMAQLRFLGNNAPVVFVDDIASLMKLANDSSEVACRSHGVDTVASELNPAATFTASGSTHRPTNTWSAAGWFSSPTAVASSGTARTLHSRLASTGSSIC